jgi:hypothetical protein
MKSIDTLHAYDKWDDEFWAWFDYYVGHVMSNPFQGKMNLRAKYFEGCNTQMAIVNKMYSVFHMKIFYEIKLDHWIRILMKCSRLSPRKIIETISTSP